MNNTSANNDQKNSPKFGHAVVIGGGISGLVTARTLIDYFEEVTIIEREDRRWPTTEVIEDVPSVPEDAFPLRVSPMIEPASFRLAYQ